MKLMKIIKKIIFGERVVGEILPPPSLKSTYPKNRPSQDEWAKQMNFGSRYGHRGSFYNKTP
jgi:hypothetical protein